MARDYSIVRSSFWTGDTGRQLRGDHEAQILALYFVTAPTSNMIGLYYLPWPTILHDTGLSDKGASKGLRRGIQLGFASYDRDSGWVFVPQMAFFQLGAKLEPKDKRIAAVQKLYDEACKCPFADDFWNLYGEQYHIQKRECSRRGIEGASGSITQEQEQEQDKEQDQEEGASPLKPQLGLSTSKVGVRGCKGEGDRFEEFWQAFPSGRREKKSKAHEAWKRAIKKTNQQVLIDAAAEYAASYQAKSQYVKGPVPWLNGGCWDDDRAAWNRTPDPRGSRALLEAFYTDEGENHVEEG